MSAPIQGALRVWWVPKTPGEPFLVDVATATEAKKLLTVLADYDLFQLAHRVKPDYCNAGGLEVFQLRSGPTADYLDWCEWEDADGNDIYEHDIESTK